MLPMMGQEPGTLDTDFQDGGILLLAPFGATSFENAQDVIALNALKLNVKMIYRF